MNDYYKEQEENAKMMYDTQLQSIESTEYKITEEQAQQILNTPPIKLPDTPERIRAFARMRELLAEVKEVSPIALSPDDQTDVDEKGDVFRDWFNEELADLEELK